MNEYLFFVLLRYAFGYETSVESITEITPEALSGLYKLSKKHDLAHLVADALDKNGLFKDGGELSKRFLQERDLAVYRYKRLEHELGQISRALEHAGIPFMPLKGSVLRNYYPAPWMRTSCDIDVLVREETLASAIRVLTEELKYSEGARGSHDVAMVAPSGVHIELHFRLTAEEGSVCDILEGVFEGLEDGWSYRYAMTPEMFYFYHIAHMAIHMRTGGCGVKPFLDLKIMRDRMALDRERVDSLLTRGNLLAFEKESVDLANCWFANAPFSDVSVTFGEYILYGGVYGNMQNHVAVEQVKRGGKVAYILSRVFVGFDELSIKYPSLKRRKLLFPLYQVYRWFDLLLNKESRDHVRATVKKTAETDAASISTTEKLFDALGL